MSEDNKIQESHVHSTSTDQEVHSHGTSCSSHSSCGCSHNHGHEELNVKRLIASAIFLLMGLIITYSPLNNVIPYFILVIIYLAGYLLVGLPIIKEAYEGIAKERDFFNEFSLMTLATVGAMALEQFPEAIAVMLFYSIGEYFQGKAVGKATRNIQSLLDIRTDEALLLQNDKVVHTLAEEVMIGDIIQIRVGDKVPLDGKLISDNASLNTVALTGESVPQSKKKGDLVLAGMINLEGVILLEVTETYNNTALSKILAMVQDATNRKSKTELLIRRIAKVYTPIVFGLAVLLVLLPIFFVADYSFRTWLYRSLTFLVISCPCALVISIPLGYFAGIGAASKRGILFKGANYLDILSRINTIVIDKTGTVTEGVFEVQKIIYTDPSIDKDFFIGALSAVESYSTHPIARAITNHYNPTNDMVVAVEDLKELAGYGIVSSYQGKQILVGNTKLLDKYNVHYDESIREIVGTTVLMSFDNKFQGAVVIADKLKEDAIDTVKGFHKNGIKNIVMLSGDNPVITEDIGRQIGIDVAIGGLLPDGKVQHIEELKKEKDNIICFVGDGINDAPALALSDVGVAMGAMGSDAAIEIADVVIQTDQPSKINEAISISKKTKSIVQQNIVLAFGIKLGVLALGALGVATMWEAVIADVGVTILAVVNSIRILKD